MNYQEKYSKKEIDFVSKVNMFILWSYIFLYILIDFILIYFYNIWIEKIILYNAYTFLISLIFIYQPIIWKIIMLLNHNYNFFLEYNNVLINYKNIDEALDVMEDKQIKRWEISGRVKEIKQELNKKNPSSFFQKEFDKNSPLRIFKLFLYFFILLFLVLYCLWVYQWIFL